MYIQLICLFLLLHYIEAQVVDLSCEDIRTFVDGHNSRRLLLAQGNVSGQPAASEMRFMIWDEELATKAKIWASQYTANHNPDRTVGSGRFTTGENIYKMGSTNKNYRLKYDVALQAWFNENKNYKFGPVTKSDSSPSKPAVGHYTQMVWSDSIYLGCGVSKRTSDKVEYFVVCNYGPSGNIVGVKPYKDGDASNKLVCFGDCSHPYGDKC